MVSYEIGVLNVPLRVDFFHSGFAFRCAGVDAGLLAAGSVTVSCNLSSVEPSATPPRHCAGFEPGQISG
jgi:hypothetical protein